MQTTRKKMELDITLAYIGDLEHDPSLSLITLGYLFDSTVLTSNSITRILELGIILEQRQGVW